MTATFTDPLHASFLATLRAEPDEKAHAWAGRRAIAWARTTL